MGQVEKREPAREHARLEEDMTPDEIADERNATWELAVTNMTSYSGCFNLGVRPDVGTLGDYAIVNNFIAEQMALRDGRLPIRMLQKKYHPERPFDNTTGETYIEQIGTPMYEEDGFRFDIPREKLKDSSWKYKPESSDENCEPDESSNENKPEVDEYDYNSDLSNDSAESSDENCEPAEPKVNQRDESESEVNEYDGESQFDTEEKNEPDVEEINDSEEKEINEESNSESNTKVSEGNEEDYDGESESNTDDEQESTPTKIKMTKSHKKIGEKEKQSLISQSKIRGLIE